ncbi:MAG: tetratricopeptide repeat protein [Proteobacteria bacterium]|nr:tetratricopeptide repeat protein [Pseudomonadota bacterium]MBU1737525.1 tetratricopeptide repeat protein [Pseudomonadota bacterium]
MQTPDKMNFLIVDDIDNMRRSIRAMLKLINYGKKHYEAGNGREALKILTEDSVKIDFIISDYNMPTMSGTELLDQVRTNKSTRDIPFLMITAEANMEVVAEAAEHDVDAYLTKPFVTASLEQKINELLRNLNSPSAMATHLRNARNLEEKGDLPGAICEAEKAIDQTSISSRPFRELGRLYLKSGNMDKSLTYFKQAIATNRLDVTSYHYLGHIYHRRGETNKAIDNFYKAMEISPRHYDRAIKFARLLFKQGKEKEAEKILRLVLKSNTGNFEAKEEIAMVCEEFKIPALAVKAFREILKEAPERTYLNIKLGNCLYMQEDYLEASRVLEKAMEKQSENIDVMLTLARIYLAMKIPVRADKWAARVLRLDPDNKEARALLAKC